MPSQFRVEYVSQSMSGAGRRTMGNNSLNQPTPQLLYLLEDDEFTSNALRFQLKPYGYNVKAFSTIEGLQRELDTQIPDVMLLDVELPDGESIDYILENLSYFEELAVPYLFLSSHGDIHKRLSSVRAGGSGYLSKPVDFNLLVDTLDRLVNVSIDDAFRVLVVDDSEAMSSVIAEILRSHGMVADVANDPAVVLDLLQDTSPDLILMDLYMPGCTGQELAGVIRQLDAYLSIPIVYLSSERDESKQMRAMGVGGDDFLTKPVDERKLIMTVSNRIERARKLRRLMVRDSLTGLLNHSTIKDKLENEVERANRNQGGFVVGMIDIDKFKNVNDTYGHATGDRVIKSLSRILQQRLRRTDLIGRYGGEEFCVVLLDTNIEHSFRIMDEIRNDFRKIAQQSLDDRIFFSSFSCGLAAFSQGASLNALQEAADAAMYQAKETGRNQVIVHKK